jgi:hypothetical protein
MINNVQSNEWELLYKTIDFNTVHSNEWECSQTIDFNTVQSNEWKFSTIKWPFYCLIKRVGVTLHSNDFNTVQQRRRRVSLQTNRLHNCHSNEWCISLQTNDFNTRPFKRGVSLQSTTLLSIQNEWKCLYKQMTSITVNQTRECLFTINWLHYCTIKRVRGSQMPSLSFKWVGVAFTK